MQYAEANSILLPGCIPGYKRDDIQLLQSSTTKRAVWLLYEESASTNGVRSVAYTTFCHDWRNFLGHVAVCKPMIDLCATCQRKNTASIRSINMSESDKSQVCVQHKHVIMQMFMKTVHIQHCTQYMQSLTCEAYMYTNMKHDVFTVKICTDYTLRLHTLKVVEEHLLCECSYYRTSVKKCCDTVQGMITVPVPGAALASGSGPEYAHYSFDFAQQVHYPHNPLQPGSMYFKTARKCAVFGICCEGILVRSTILVTRHLIPGKVPTRW